jgi:putative oxidoreductase
MKEDAGKLILRVALGVFMLLHGIAKLRDGVDGIGGMLQAHGLPGFIAYGVYIGEVLAPLLVIAGFHARVGAALMAITMVVAIALAHAGELFELGRGGGWALELQGFFLFTSIAVTLIGPGRFAINRK